MYWHLSPYLQKPYSKKLWQSLVLYLKLNVFFSLISSSLWAKAHWSKRKNYKFVEWTKSPLIPISTHLSIKINITSVLYFCLKSRVFFVYFWLEIVWILMHYGFILIQSIIRIVFFFKFYIFYSQKITIISILWTITNLEDFKIIFIRKYDH